MLVGVSMGSPGIIHRPLATLLGAWLCSAKRISDMPLAGMPCWNFWRFHCVGVYVVKFVFVWLYPRNPEKYFPCWLLLMFNVLALGYGAIHCFKGCLSLLLVLLLLLLYVLVATVA